jgi:integrase
MSACPTPNGSADPADWFVGGSLHRLSAKTAKLTICVSGGLGDSHFIGMVRVLDRVCASAGLTEVTPHVLRHTFASVAGNLNFSELTIKGLLGHSSRGVTQGYVHLDVALVVAAERVSAEIASILDGKEGKLAANINTRVADRMNGAP